MLECDGRKWVGGVGGEIHIILAEYSHSGVDSNSLNTCCVIASTYSVLSRRF